jgi:tRNA (guanine-N7-)-methyltransferase
MDALIIDEVFNHEIDKIYLNFSDPWPKERHAKRRLTSNIFLDKYQNIFRNNPIIEMKTDNRNLFEFSLISFNQHGYLIKDISLDLHNSNKDDNIMTEYEKKFSLKNNCIYYVKVEKNG